MKEKEGRGNAVHIVGKTKYLMASAVAAVHNISNFIRSYKWDSGIPHLN